MLNVIICDDISSDRKKIINVVKKFFDKSDINPNIHEFCDYNSKFVETMKSELINKIYILDIETPSRSGIDIARIIRKSDVVSPIIFLTGHRELGEVVITKDINFISFINKFDNSAQRLTSSLKVALKMLNKKQILKFNDHSSVYTIDFDNILYITTDTVLRKTIIVTNKHEYKVSNTLRFFLNILTDDFVQSHKSCIINKTRISNINYNNNTILFDNGKTIDLLSNKYKKGIDLNV